MARDSLSELKKLLKTPELAELGPGPRAAVHSIAQINSALANADVPESSRELVRALILLWHDHLDEAHRIAQEIENADGSFIHAIMHRREPDFGNSKYWWRHTGNHPAFPEIATRVAQLLKERSAEDLGNALLPRGEWDAFAFVDVCEAANAQNENLLREIQRIETEVMLEHLLDGGAC